MKNKILSFVFYILKTYILMSVTFAVICGCYQYWYLLTNNITEYTPFDAPYFIAIYVGVIYPWFNIWVFIILFFYRFNKIEIICETFLFTVIMLLGDIIINKYELILPYMVLLMLLYIALKKTILKFCLKRKERNLPQ